MKKKYCFFILCISSSLFAQPVRKTPQEIQAELDSAETALAKAEQMFDPWYTGPLLTPSASMVAPGYGTIQPYFFINQNYAVFDEDRKSVPLAHDSFGFNPVLVLQFGVTDSVDTAVTMQTQTNWLEGKSAGGFGDIKCRVGFLIQPQTLYVPKMKFIIQETFPTGKYQQLRTDALDGAGKGAYNTAFTFAMSKILFWTTAHPVNTRLALVYKIVQPLTVHGINAYGGGSDTHGRVRPGSEFNADLGIEVSFDQHWVLATDFVYTAIGSTSFKGHLGTNTTGETAHVGKGFSDNFSLAPALEYNWSSNLGILAGVQFSVYGRNSSNFISTILSLTYAFPVGPWNKS
jgi:hypothetical protein